MSKKFKQHTLAAFLQHFETLYTINRKLGGAITLQYTSIVSFCIRHRLRFKTHENSLSIVFSSFLLPIVKKRPVGKTTLA